MDSNNHQIGHSIHKNQIKEEIQALSLAPHLTQENQGSLNLSIIISKQNLKEGQVINVQSSRNVQNGQSLQKIDFESCFQPHHATEFLGQNKIQGQDNQEQPVLLKIHHQQREVYKNLKKIQKHFKNGNIEYTEQIFEQMMEVKKRATELLRKYSSM